MNVWIARHAAREDKQDNVVYTGGCDPAITREGIDQAKRTGKALSSQRVDYIYASPFRRTVMTAVEVAKIVGVKVQVHNALCEVLLPSMYRAAPRLDAYKMDTRQQHYVNKQRLGDMPSYPETEEEARDRCHAAVDHIVATHRGETIGGRPVGVLIVTHAALAVNAYEQLSGKAWPEGRGPVPECCSLTRFVHENGGWRLCGKIADASHIACPQLDFTPRTDKHGRRQPARGGQARMSLAEQIALVESERRRLKNELEIVDDLHARLLRIESAKGGGAAGHPAAAAESAHHLTALSGITTMGWEHASQHSFALPTESLSMAQSSLLCKSGVSVSSLNKKLFSEQDEESILAGDALLHTPGLEKISLHTDKSSFQFTALRGVHPPPHMLNAHAACTSSADTPAPEGAFPLALVMDDSDDALGLAPEHDAPARDGGAWDRAVPSPPSTGTPPSPQGRHASGSMNEGAGPARQAAAQRPPNHPSGCPAAGKAQPRCAWDALQTPLSACDRLSRMSSEVTSGSDELPARVGRLSSDPHAWCFDEARAAAAAIEVVAATPEHDRDARAPAQQPRAVRRAGGSPMSPPFAAVEQGETRVASLRGVGSAGTSPAATVQRTGYSPSPAAHANLSGTVRRTAVPQGEVGESPSDFVLMGETHGEGSASPGAATLFPLQRQRRLCSLRGDDASQVHTPRLDAPRRPSVPSLYHGSSAASTPAASHDAEPSPRSLGGRAQPRRRLGSVSCAVSPVHTPRDRTAQPRVRVPVSPAREGDAASPACGEGLLRPPSSTFAGEAGAQAYASPGGSPPSAAAAPLPRRKSQTPRGGGQGGSRAHMIEAIVSRDNAASRVPVP